MDSLKVVKEITDLSGVHAVEPPDSPVDLGNPSGSTKDVPVELCLSAGASVALWALKCAESSVEIVQSEDDLFRHEWDSTRDPYPPPLAPEH